MLSSMYILPHCCWQFNLTVYRSICWSFISILYLAHDLIILQSPITCHWKIKCFCLKSACSFWQSKVVHWRKYPFHCIIHTQTHVALELMPYGLWFGRFPFFIFYGLTCSQHSTNDHAWIQLLLPLYLQFSSEALNCLAHYCYSLSQHC